MKNEITISIDDAKFIFRTLNIHQYLISELIRRVGPYDEAYTDLFHLWAILIDLKSKL